MKDWRVVTDEAEIAVARLGGLVVDGGEEWMRRYGGDSSTWPSEPILKFVYVGSGPSKVFYVRWCNIQGLEPWYQVKETIK